MPFSDFRSISTDPVACQVAAALLARLSIPSDETPIEDKSGEENLLIAEAMAVLVERKVVVAAGVVRQEQREWVAAGWVGAAKQLPIDLVAAAMEAGQMRCSGEAIAVPLETLALGGDHRERGSSTEGSKAAEALLGVRGPADRSAVDPDGFADRMLRVAQVLTWGLALLRSQYLERQRNKRWGMMLRIAAQWSLQEESASLLEGIARGAAELLDAERATIFLWDREGKKLIGRPALGVAGNRLEVKDSEGVVGAVLQSGQPRRWHQGEDSEREINRSVDRKLSFQTRSLLAVPLWDQTRLNKPLPSSEASLPGPQVRPRDGRQGTRDPQSPRRPIGVFEVINRRHGVFSADDEIALEELSVQAAAAIQSTQSREALVDNRDRWMQAVAEGVQIIGDHPSIVALRSTAARVAETDLAVLILGENGTGKEVLARSIHFASPRRHEPFVAVNCAALVETLLESELFGHERGAFTDAHQSRAGKFELASGGTIFLDEIGDLSASGQAKLLRVLEEKKVVRVGGSQNISVNVRVIAATNQPLIRMVQEKRFREDLYFRLNVVTLNLPPLRQRGEDVRVLAEHFLTQFAQQIGRKVPALSSQAVAAMATYSWPGNIRELRNIMERVSYLFPGETIHAEELGIERGSSSVASSAAERWASGLEGNGAAESDSAAASRELGEATRLFQIRHIERAIARCHGNMTDAATELGLHRSNLYRKLRQLGIAQDEPPLS